MSSSTRFFLIVVMTLFLISAPLTLSQSSGAGTNSTASASSTGAAGNSTAHGSSSAAALSSATAMSAASSAGSSAASSVASTAAPSAASSVASTAPAASSVASTAALSAASSAHAGSSSSTPVVVGSSSAGSPSSAATPFSSSTAANVALSSISSRFSSAAAMGSSSAVNPVSTSSSSAAAVTPMSSPSSSAVPQTPGSSSSSSAGSIIPPLLTSSMGINNSALPSSSSSSPFIETLSMCSFNYFAVPTYVNLTYMFVNATLTFNSYQPIYVPVNGNNLTCYNIIALSGFRNVFFNNTIFDSSLVPSLGVNNAGTNMFCQQSPYLTPAGIQYATTASDNFVDATDRQVGVAYNATNMGNSNPAVSTWYEYYTDVNGTLRQNPITQFNLVNCGSGSNQQSSNDATLATKSTTSYLLALVMAISSAVLMLAL